MEEVAGIILALLAVALFVQLVQHGWGGVRAWLRAKVTGHPVGA